MLDESTKSESVDNQTDSLKDCVSPEGTLPCYGKQGPVSSMV